MQDVPTVDVDVAVSPLTLSPQGAAYFHTSLPCLGAECPGCYKYACPECGARSNLLMAPCWKCLADHRDVDSACASAHEARAPSDVQDALCADGAASSARFVGQK